MARKGIYQEWISEDGLTKIRAWARDGLTNEQICKNIGVSVKQFYEWLGKYSELSEALKKGKEVVDIEVENALYKKALGYNVKLQKTFKVKEVIYQDGKRVKETERLEVGYDEQHIPADTTAQIFWLKNRKPNEWREKVLSIDKDGCEDLTPLSELLKKKE